MEKSNYHKLILRTSFVTPHTIQEFPNHDLLPIFIARNISNSGLIGKWNGTSIHFKELSPSPILLRDWKSGRIDRDEFEKKFLLEMSEINFDTILRRISFLCDVSRASGAVLMGYGSDRLECHRSILSDIINQSGILENKVIELIL
jgi:uncharacterized protein YeaO (DUF488 family)